MNGIDEQQIIDLHHESKELYPIVGGGSVVGQAVDENNRLIYVVRNGEDMGLVHAVNYPIIPVLYTNPPSVTVIGTPPAMLQ